MSKPKFIEWFEAEGGVMKARRSCGDFVYLSSGGGSYYGRATHEIVRESGEWPTDADLITIADGGDPEREGHPGHFGGAVNRGRDENTKVVTVYTD